MNEEQEDKMLEISKKYVRGICECMGEDPDREGLQDTPRRIARSMEFLLSGYAQDKDVERHLKRQFSEDDYNQLIVVDNISFSSLCEHHILGFAGKVHVGYIPNKGQVVGLSKIPRVVDIYSRRLQQQERLTYQIAEAIDKHVQPKGVIVFVEGVHLCMRARGVQKPNAVMKTTALRGVFKDDKAARDEFYEMIKIDNL